MLTTKAIALNYGEVRLEFCKEDPENVMFVSLRFGNQIALTAADANLLANELRSMAELIDPKQKALGDAKE